MPSVKVNPPTEPTYDLLGLSKEELTLIYVYAMHTSGCYTSSPRKHASSLINTIAPYIDGMDGNDVMTTLYAQFSVLMENSVHFESYTTKEEE